MKANESVANRASAVEWVKEVAKNAAITFSFTAVYVALCNLNLPLAKSSFQGALFGKTFRVASMLRGPILVSLPANIGVQLGASIVSKEGGGWTLGYFILPVAVGLVGFGFQKLSQKWGRAWYKDILLLAAFGFVSGLFITANLSTLASFAPGEVAKSFLSAAAFSKIFSNTVITAVLGYPTLLAFDAVGRLFKKEK